ncbi:hypothetical protein [uncultured Salinicola sp.]|uniref:hypothetical protein n=1 Tax=uncultured Salinicola sp. TaxID=1193542 RepID=UPI0026143192|nr:hypothetical protein [uncultured Salinicola sp.]|tara:strand:+ start:4370 stop:4624 length:255 start_codon:yes stop_codon:yes gene_type:complete
MKPHEKLIGKSHRELKDLAPEATHQHRKGGLYRDLGIAQDAETKQPYEDPRGPLRAWLHVHPHEKSLLLRPASEDDRFTALGNE